MRVRACECARAGVCACARVRAPPSLGKREASAPPSPRRPSARNRAALKANGGEASVKGWGVGGYLGSEHVLQGVAELVEERFHLHPRRPTQTASPPARSDSFITAPPSCPSPVQPGPPESPASPL